MLKKLLVFFLFALMCSFPSFSQEGKDAMPKKTNPIIFGDVNFGYSRFSEHAFFGGLSLNYQTQKNLFKFRFMQSLYIEKIEWFLIFPTSTESIAYDEYSLMYGKRYVKDDFAYHFTAGISHNKITDRLTNVATSSSFIGFPLEVGINWFPAEKGVYRIFGLIPVGKPTSFARSAGFKLMANIAKESYVGVALTVGLGMHKHY